MELSNKITFDPPLQSVNMKLEGLLIGWYLIFII